MSLFDWFIPGRGYRERPEQYQDMSPMPDHLPGLGPNDREDNLRDWGNLLSQETQQRSMTRVNEESLLKYLQIKALTEAAQTGHNILGGASDDRKRERTLRQLDIISKKKSLGLPVDDEDYEYTVNNEKPFQNPGEQITLATTFSRNRTAPILNLGPLAGLAATRGRNVSRISKYFGL